MPHKTNGTNETNSTPDSKVKRVIVLLAQLREAMEGLEPGQETVFGDSLRHALDYAESRKGFYPQYYADVKPRQSQAEQMLQNARRNLGTQKGLLADLKKRARMRSMGEGGKVPQDAIDAAQERVSLAEEQLARAEGRIVEHTAELRAQAQAAAKAEALEAAHGQAAWQARVKAKIAEAQGHDR